MMIKFIYFNNIFWGLNRMVGTVEQLNFQGKTKSCKMLVPGSLRYELGKTERTRTVGPGEEVHLSRVEHAKDRSQSQT